MPEASKYWLMKAEPDSRVVKGKDVKFSVDDFEAVKTSPWEGVRNHEAKNLMKSMTIGDQVLFYHSNCKNPGIAGFAEVSKEAYPDYTAWDSSHPYYDEKSDKENPRWYMVDVTFKSRAKNFVPLSLMKRIASLPTDEPPETITYIGEEGVRAVKKMALVNRGRLSVQPLNQDAWDAVKLLAEKGGWDIEMAAKRTKIAVEPKETSTKRQTKERKARTKTKKGDDGAEYDEEAHAAVHDPGEGDAKRAGGASNSIFKPNGTSKTTSTSIKRKAKWELESEDRSREPPRRSQRMKK